MANFVFNSAKGRVAELVNRVDSSDPTNAVLILIVINTSATDATLKDLATMTAVEADANTAEVANSGYSRKVLTDADITNYSVDNTSDLVKAVIADQTWTAVAAGTAWTDLLVCYLADSTGGTTSANNANIIPLTCHDFAVTPDGNDIVADFDATNGFYQAS